MVKFKTCRYCEHFKFGHATNNIDRTTTICDIQPKMPKRRMTDMPLFRHVYFEQHICDKFQKKNFKTD